MLAWKKRTGLGGSIVVSQKWERRWIVVTGNKMVYYSLGKEDAPTPRGVLDLVEQSATINVPAKNASDAPTEHELDIVATSDDGAHVISWKLCFDSQQDQLHLLETVHNILYQGGLFDEKDFDRFEHDLESGDHVFRWEMIIMPPVIYPIQIHGIVLEAGRNCVIIGDFGLTGYGKQEGADFNHAEDHNTSIMAAWKKLRPKEDQRLNIVTLLDPKEIRKWKKADYEHSFVSNHVPKNKFSKSLSKFFKSTTIKKSEGGGDSVGTDATVVEGSRERTATSDSTGSNSAGGRLSKFFSKSVVIRQDSAVTDATVVHEPSSSESHGESNGDAVVCSGNGQSNSEAVEMDKKEEAKQPSKLTEVASGEAAGTSEKDGAEEASGESDKVQAQSSGAALAKSKGDEEKDSGGELKEDEGSCEFADVSLSGTEDSSSSAAECETKESGEIAKAKPSHDELNEDVENVASSAVASSHQDAAQQQQAREELPKSDPKKIVLARAHFLLEYGEEILPPYHVFYSNSECIAVWCKTGRWSTLQTAVYLTGHSVGAAKSSTMATLGVAAAHAMFAPVVAVGGLIWVSAPMVILQQSRKKWDEATMKLTKLFWEWAPNEVFVEAIENWSDIN